MTLRLCLKPKFNCPNCFVSREGFTRDDLPDQFRDDTAIRIRLTKTRPLLEADLFSSQTDCFPKRSHWK
jgi:hypothetical protein